MDNEHGKNGNENVGDDASEPTVAIVDLVRVMQRLKVGDAISVACSPSTESAVTNIMLSWMLTTDDELASGVEIAAGHDASELSDMAARAQRLDPQELAYGLRRGEIVGHLISAYALMRQGDPDFEL